MRADGSSDAGMSTPTRLRQRIQCHLAAFTRRPVTDATLRRAAVAIVVLENTAGSGATFLITRRGGDLRAHKGQWALPGGRLDPGESATEAARRELHEELGLDLPGSAVLGKLDDYPTRSGYRITPVVMWGGGSAHLQPNPDEVAAVHRIPLSDLDRPEVPHLEQIPQSERPVLSIPFASLGHKVYAPTAAMIYQFREVALHGRETRVKDYEQPLFAWR